MRRTRKFMKASTFITFLARKDDKTPKLQNFSDFNNYSFCFSLQTYYKLPKVTVAEIKVVIPRK